MTDQPTPSPLERLGALLSGGDETVAHQLRYFSETSEARDRELGVGSHTDPTVTLISVLREQHVVYCDYKEDALEVLDALQRPQGGVLAASGIRHQLRQRYQGSNLGVANFLDDPEFADWMAMANECGYVLEGIDEGSDSYALVLIPRNAVDLASELASEAEIVWYFARTQPDVSPLRSPAPQMPPPDMAPPPPPAVKRPLRLSDRLRARRRDTDQ